MTTVDRVPSIASQTMDPGHPKLDASGLQTFVHAPRHRHGSTSPGCSAIGTNSARSLPWTPGGFWPDTRAGPVFGNT